MLKIKGFEDYTIDEQGNVFSIRKNKYLKQTINKNGYLDIAMTVRAYQIILQKYKKIIGAENGKQSN